ncbi:hypothetical protein [Nocardia sp. BMG111209]|uniref:hypothetical protein n=1 Tax=Nocardia sp. BMG111209 TaxID=1160137 RepID=UPI000382E0CA|nr:hypothetical protein [Nocardia sp. BMG111209]
MTSPSATDRSPAPNRPDRPDAILDKLDWPGLLLLLLGVATLGWTVTGGAGPRVLGGSVATAVALVAGFGWMVAEYARVRTERGGRS